MTVGSLFAGIGGFDLGFERAGFTLRWQVENDPYATRVLEKHWPGVRRYGDICTVDWGTVEPVDVICGGDPCQRNSNAWRVGTGAASLGDQFIAAVDQRRPRFVVRENPSAVRADAPWPWWRFRASLERLDYAVLPVRFRACCFGADHRRDRLFLLAALQDTDRAGLERAIGQEVARADDRGYDADVARPDRWSAAPRVCRGTDGISHRVDRLRGLGNAVVPQVTEWIARRIAHAAVTR